SRKHCRKRRDGGGKRQWLLPILKGYAKSIRIHIRRSRGSMELVILGKPPLPMLTEGRTAMNESVWIIEARWRSGGPDAPWIPQADYTRLTKENADKKVAELTVRNTLSQWRAVPTSEARPA